MSNVLDVPSVIFYDVDNTLVLWDLSRIDCPEIKIPYLGDLIPLRVHTVHVKMLKSSYANGHVIIVWSRQGAKWAESVVEALGISSSVYLCMPKPLVYVDDHLDFFNPRECLNQFISGKFGG